MEQSCENWGRGEGTSEIHRKALDSFILCKGIFLQSSHRNLLLRTLWYKSCASTEVELIFYQFTTKPAVLCPNSPASTVVHGACMVPLAAGSGSSFLLILSRMPPSCDSKASWQQTKIQWDCVKDKQEARRCILPGDHRRSLWRLGLEHRAYEGRQRVLGWFSLERKGRADLMSSHSVVHKRQEGTICKGGHSGLPIKESFSPWGWSVTGRGAWRCCGISSLGNTPILAAQGTASNLL